MKKILIFLLCFVPLIAIAERVTNMQIGSDSITRGLWHFGANVGSKLYDTSGNFNEGSITGTVWSDGFLGRGLDFNGSTDKISITDSPSLSALSTMTVVACIKTTSTSTGWMGIISKYEATNREWYLAIIPGGASPNLRFYLYDEIWNAYILREDTSGGINDGKWHYIVATWSGGKSTDTIKIFVDGVQVDDIGSVSGNFEGIRDKDRAVEIGVRGDLGNYFEGTIDEIAIYNRVLLKGEIYHKYSRRVQAND